MNPDYNKSIYSWNQTPSSTQKENTVKEKENLSQIFRAINRENSPDHYYSEEELFGDREIIEISDEREEALHPKTTINTLYLSNNHGKNDKEIEVATEENNQLWEKIYKNFSLFKHTGTTPRFIKKESKESISEYQIPFHSYISICNYMRKDNVIKVLCSRNLVDIFFEGPDLKQNMNLFFDHLHVYYLGQRSHIFYWASNVQLRMQTFVDPVTQKYNHSLQIVTEWRKVFASEKLRLTKLMLADREICSLDKIFF